MLFCLVDEERPRGDVLEIDTPNAIDLDDDLELLRALRDGLREQDAPEARYLVSGDHGEMRGSWPLEYTVADAVWSSRDDPCPTCGSTAPEWHPSMALGGEVQVCTHPFHARPTAENTTQRIQELRALLPAYYPGRSGWWSR